MSKGFGKMQLQILEELKAGNGLPFYSRMPLPRGVQDLSALRWKMARAAGLKRGKNTEYQSFNASFHRATRRLREDGYLLPVEGFPATYVKLKPYLRVAK